MFNDLGNNNKKLYTENIRTTYHYNYDNTGSDHSIELVGWDDSIDYSQIVEDGSYLPNNKLPKHKGAFIAKNSYGEYFNYGHYAGASFTTDGYMYISYDESNFLDDIKSFKQLETRSNLGTIYENDPLGKCLIRNPREISCDNSSSLNKTFVVSRFEPEQGEELLKRVYLNTTDKETRFKIFVSPTGEFSDFTEAELNYGNIIIGRDANGYYANKAGEYVFELKRPYYINSDSFLVGIEYYNGSGIGITVEANTYGLEDNSDIYSAPQLLSEHAYIMKPIEGNNTEEVWRRNENNYIDRKSVV